ncbi:MAG: hypothetical protein JWM56_393 [Candidatus Peribacteria bacterium]|nr:hypothetical protein [Candidatus Peribacteria bacterium]
MNVNTLWTEVWERQCSYNNYNKQKHTMAYILILNVIINEATVAFISPNEPFYTWSLRLKTVMVGAGRSLKLSLS